MILLDTHVLLWYLLGSRLLPAEVRTRIKDEALVFVSTASIWEIGVKARLGKLRIDGKPIHSKEKVEQIVRACEEEEFQFLAVNLQASVEAPFLNGNHRDPFDRILGAQSLYPNRLTIVSGDAVFDEMSKDIRRYWTGTANPSKPQ